ncbi:uncharacterized protein PRCAT00000796001 [Priceomyces carsonii]|uniref:uncharacterized protein n=1 Tax=Priceomyces carsonii TaxID=28549 RepID=UPI002ED7A42F|nr:unnamed protein product [Priceomyces carsonii]
MSFSIYDLDEDIRKLLNLDNFLEGLSVNDFIEELSKDHFLKGAEVNKLEYLDPKPYIRTFESTLRELKRLNEQAKDQQSRVEKEVENCELKHSENVIQLSTKINKITKKFDKLDVKISDVTRKIDPVGQSLTKVSTSRDRSMETIFLIRAYHGFYTKEKYDPLESLRVSKKQEDKIKCAKTLNNLITLAKKIESPEISKTTTCLNAIEKFGETMERNLLNRFEVVYEDNEFDMMKDIADILFHFNGGGNVVRTFVNKNDLLLEAEREDDQEEETLLDNEVAWINLADPNFKGDIKDVSTESLLDRLKFDVKGQARIVQQVFEDPIPVLKIFIQRIYAQMIQNKVSALLQYSLSINSLAHVRVLNYLYVLVNDFTNDVKEFLNTNDFDKENELASILDQSTYDLFIEYTSDNTYFDREKKNLEETIYYIVHKFNSFNEKAVTNRYLSLRIENIDNVEYNEKPDNVDKYGFYLSEKKRLNKFANFMKSHLSDKKRASTDLEKVSDQEYEEYSKLNISKVETVIKSAIESIARLLELTTNKTPEYSLEILEILLFDFGKLYVGAGLDVAYEKLRQENVASKINSVQPFDLSYLSTFSLVTEILYLLSSCIKRIILPCAVNSPNIKNRMSNLTNGYISRCELSLNIILSETIEMIGSRLNYLLSRQRKKDFLCDNITEDDTEACELSSEFLLNIHESLKLYISKTNLRNVLIKVGMNFLNQLLEHYKKFTVNSTGGIILTKDVIRYQSTIDSWEIDELSERYQLLKEIGNLFTVHPHLISSLITEGQLANLKPYTKRQYISKRTDFNPSYIERFFSFKR